MPFFDLSAARKAGHDDSTILDGLASQTKGFDLKAARESGYDDTTILEGLRDHHYRSEFKALNPSATDEDLDYLTKDRIKTLAKPRQTEAENVKERVKNYQQAGSSRIGAEQATVFDLNLENKFNARHTDINTPVRGDVSARQREAWQQDYKATRPVDRTAMEAVGDTGLQLLKGGQTIAGAAPSLISPESDAAQFFKKSAEFFDSKQSESIKRRVAASNKAISAADEDGIAAQIAEAASQYWDDPGLAARFVFENLPSMIPGIGITKVAQAAALARGATALKAAGVATTAGGFTNAVLNGGGARGEAFEDIKATLIARGMSEADAAEVAKADSLLPAAVGAGTGFLMTKAGGLEKAVAGGYGGVGGALRRGATAGAVELGGEQIEEVAPKLATNYQASQYDGRGIGQDVGRTMVETAIGAGPGAVLAGGVSALDGQQQTQPVQAPANEQIGDIATPPAAPVAASQQVDPVQPVSVDRPLSGLSDFENFMQQERADVMQRRMGIVEKQAATQQAGIQQRMESDLESTDARVQGGMQRTDQERRIADIEQAMRAVNPLAAFAAIRTSQNLPVIPEDVAIIKRRMGQADVFQALPEGIEPSAPNEMPDMVPLRREPVQAQPATDRIQKAQRMLAQKGMRINKAGTHIVDKNGGKHMALQPGESDQLGASNGATDQGGQVSPVVAQGDQGESADVSGSGSDSQTVVPGGLAGGSAGAGLPGSTDGSVVPAGDAGVQGVTNDRFTQVDAADEATRQDMLQSAARNAKSNDDLVAVLDRLPDPLLTEAYVGNTSRIAYDVLKNPAASEETKARASAIYENATRSTTPATPLPASAPAPVTQQPASLPVEIAAPSASTSLTRKGRFTVEFNGQEFEVGSIKDAADKWNKFVDASQGGVSEIGNGVVIKEDGNPVARVSYNGRIWDMNDNEITGDRIATQPEPLPQTQGQAQGAEGKAEGVAPSIADIQSGRATVDRVNGKIDEWVNHATNNGARPMDRNWERSAVKRFIDAEIAPMLAGKQYGNRAAAKIAVGKSVTFDDLRAAIAKYADDPVKVTQPADTKTDEVSTPEVAKRDKLKAEVEKAKVETVNPTTKAEFQQAIEDGKRAHFDYAGVDGTTIWIEPVDDSDNGWVVKEREDGSNTTFTKGGGMRMWSRDTAIRTALEKAEFRFTKWKPIAESIPVSETQADSKPDDDLDAMFDDILAEEVAKRETPKAKMKEEVEKARAPRKPAAQDGDFWTSSTREDRKKMLDQVGRQDLSENYSAVAWQDLSQNLQAKLREENGVKQPVGEKKPVTPQVPVRTASQSAVSAIKNTADGFNAAIDGLGALFGGKGTLGSGPNFSEETYAKAKPLFQQAVKNFSQAGADIKEMMRAIINEVLNRFGKDVAGQMKPYVLRFVEDVKSGAILKETETRNDQRTEGQGGATLDGVVTPEVGDTDQGGQGGRGTEPRGDSSGTGNPPVDGTGGETGRSGGDRPAATDPTEAGKGRVAGGRGGRSRKGSGASKDDAGTQDAVVNNTPLADFVIGSDVSLGSGGQMAKYRDNIAAIKLIKQLEAELRRATPAEQRTLARYVGWGGIPNAFKNPITGEVKEDWAKEVAELESLMTPKELRAASASTRNAHFTSQPVVNFMWRAASRLGFNGGLVLEPSVGTGNFIGLLPDNLRADTHMTGIELDSLTARIAGALYPRSNIVQSGFEKLPLPDDTFDMAIGNPPFGSESLRFKYSPELNGTSIHNQFFRASMDAVKPEGLQIMIVSRFLMDKQDTNDRLELAKEARLLGAIRLPGVAFKGNALTEVVTDILFLQKRTAAESGQMAQAVHERNKKIPANEPTEDRRMRLARESLLREAMAWVDTGTVKDPNGGDPLVVNRYFITNPQMIAGVMDRSGSMRQQNDIDVKLRPGETLEQAMDAAMRYLPEGVMPSLSDEVKANTQDAHKRLGESLSLYATGAEEGSIRFDPDGALMQVIERVGLKGELALTKVRVTPFTPWSGQLSMNLEGKWFRTVPKMGEDGKPVKLVKNGKVTKQNVYEREIFARDSDIPGGLRLGEKAFAVVKQLVTIRDLMVEQLNLETNAATSAKMEANRAKLKSAYDAFVKQHGYISEPKNAGVVASMPDEGLLLSLEQKFKREVTAAKAKATGRKAAPAYAEPSAILSRPVGIPPKRNESADSIGDAVAMVLSESGRMDMDRLKELRGKTLEEVAAELTDGDKPLAYYDPEQGNALVEKNEYLSGNVRRKLAAARDAKLEANIAALELVQPELWSSDKVTPKVGSTWIPAQVFAEFANHLLGTEDAKVTFAKLTNSFQVYSKNAGAAATTKWGTPRLPGNQLLELMLNSRKIAIYDPADRYGGPYFNQEETDKALDKQKEILEEFDTWIFKDMDRRQALTQIFNDEFNVRVNRQHDGSHMQFPGKVPDEIISLRRGQVNAIWRGVVENFVLYDHAVGAGKTFTGIARAMERRRMGLSKKPMIVVPNHLVKEWQIQTYRLYPGAKVLAATKKDLEPKNRRRLFAKIAAGDWDVVIVPHSSFGMISLSQETEERFLEAQLQLANAALEAAEAEQEPGTRFKSIGVKAAEALVKKLETRMDAARTKKRDRLVTFEQMGVDDLTVDESHEFKNLQYSSNLSDVRGMGNPSGSDKALDMYMKIRLMHENKGSVAFMTGTPISNSAAEIYSIMRYLAPDLLNEMELEHFDAFRTMFVDATVAFEPTDSGGGIKEVTRLGRPWSNMRALMDAYYSIADVVTNDDIKAWYAEDNQGKEFPLPKVKGGERKAIAVDPTPEQLSVLLETVAAFDSLPDIQDPKERNIARLRLMDRARKVSLHVKSVDPKLNDAPGGKLDVAVSEVVRIYKQWNTDKGTQLVFLDRGVPKSKGDATILKAYDAAIAERDAAEQKGDEAAFARANDKLDGYDANEIRELRAAQTSNWNAYQHIKDGLVASGIPANEIAFIQDYNSDADKEALFGAVRDGSVRVLIGSTPRMGAGTNVQERLVALHHIDATWKPSDIEQREGRIIRQGNALYEKYTSRGIPFEVEINAYVTKRTVDAKLWALNSMKLKMINAIRYYDGSFEMDFDDEDAGSMAEISALASGDPLMLERVKLISETDKLYRQQRSFNRRIEAAESNIVSAKRALSDNPAKIIRLEEIGAAVADVMEREESLRQNKKLTLIGEVYTDTSSARWALSQEVTRQQAGDDKAPIEVEINGKTFKSKTAADDAIVDALGDDDPFRAEVNGREMVRRSEYAREMIKVMGETYRPDVFVQVGEIAGIPITVSTSSRYERNYVELTGSLKINDKGGMVSISGTYDVTPTGHKGGDIKLTVMSLRPAISEFMKDLAMTGRVDFQINNLESAMKSAEKDIPIFEAATKETFKHAEEFKEKVARLKVVEAELEGRGKAASAAATPPQAKEIPDDAFFISIDEAAKYIPDAKEIQIPSISARFFVAHKAEGQYKWAVFEKSTGKRLSGGETKKEAILSAETKAASMGDDKIREVIGQWPAITDEQKRAAMASNSTRLSRAPGYGIAQRDAQAIVDVFKSANRNAPPIIVLEDVRKAPQSLIDEIQTAGAENDVEGAFHKGTIYLFPQNLESAERAAAVLTHEGRHFAFKAMKGKALDSILMSIYNTNERVRRLADAKKKALNLDSLVEATEEALADLDPATLQGLKGWRMLVANFKLKMREFAIALRKAGFGKLADFVLSKVDGWTDADVAAMLRNSDRFVRSGRGDGSGRTMLQRVWHGTPHLWNPEPGFPHGRPRLDKMGTGEGAQAFGWGFYIAEDEDVGAVYRKNLTQGFLVDGSEVPSGKFNNIYKAAMDGDLGEHISYLKAVLAANDELPPHYLLDAREELSLSESLIGKTVTKGGSLYQLDIPDATLPFLLDWDKPLLMQSKQIKELLKKSGDWNAFRANKDNFASPQDTRGAMLGRNLYAYMAWKHGGDKAASEYLASLGIVGNRYLDGQSRKDGAGSFNYVIWDQPTLDRIAMLERNGEKLDSMREGARLSRQGDTITVDGKERSAADAEYFDAVQRGDMDAAQRMVDMKLSASGGYWNGTPSGNLRGGVSGLHIGTKQAATEALEARIGIPADGRPWDGTRKYGETLLAGRDQVASGQFGQYRNTGYNSRSPRGAFYARDYEMPTVGDGVKVDPDWKPYVRPVLVVGETSNTQRSPMSDSRANATMKGQITRGTAKRGFYYRNEGEDYGSVSAVFPNGDAVRVKLPDSVTRDDDGNVIPLSQRFDATNPDIRFSRRQGNADPVWSSEPISKMDTFLYEITDKQVDTKRTIEAIKKTGKEIADKWNTYIQEALYHGRTAKKTDDFLRNEAEPLIKKMADAKVTQDELNQYLHARHAIERNRVMKERNPDREDNDGLSGMTDEQARSILAGAKPELAEIAKSIDAILRKTRAEMVSYGLEKQETMDAWAEMYEHYVPLKREGFEQRPGTGMGFAVRGSSTREATGSHRAVDNILANVAMQRERAIVRGEKNRVALSLYGLAKQFPNSKFWKLDKPAQITQINPETGLPEVVPGDMADYKVPRVKALQHDVFRWGVSVGGKRVGAFKTKGEALAYVDGESLAGAIVGKLAKPYTESKVVERVDPNYKGRNNVLTVRINGEDRAIIFNEQEPRALRMVEALKNLDADQLGEILGGIGRVTRYIASVNTQYNPVFGVINLMRDLQTGAFNLSSTELKGKQADVIGTPWKLFTDGHAFQALSGIYRDVRIAKNGESSFEMLKKGHVVQSIFGAYKPSEYAGLWEEFQGVGGQTGYRQMFATSKDRAEAIEHLLDPEWWQKSKLGKALTLNGFIAKPEQYLFDKVGKQVFQWLSDYNLAMENGVRLAAYKVGIENGMTKESAAFLAKNLTVNFNKKGRVATQAGALYAFFNASAQGTARIAETLNAGAKDGEYLGKVGKQIVYGGITLGAMQAVVLMLAGFGDDEPPEFIRERNLIIPVPGTEKGYVTIPMPLGFHVLPNIGRTIMESAVYGKPLDRMTDLLMTMLESFNPIGTGASMAQTISPTVFDPVVALSENKDWTGKAIYREDFSKNNPTPGFTRTKDSASALSKGVAWGINAITGGTDYTPGRFSPTPDEIDYLIGQATGGVGREVTKAMTTAGAIATGEDLPLYKVPLVGRLVGTSADNAAIRDKFYDHIRELNLHKAEIKGRKENGESTMEYRKDNPESRLIGLATEIESDVRDLQKRRKKYLEEGKREKVKMIELQIAARMNKLNRRMREAQK